VSENWLEERLFDFYRTSLRFEKILYEESSKFQDIIVAKSEFFGNILLLDGVIQLTQLDNSGYHEMMSHIPLMAHENPKRVLVVGGGDGGILTQVLKHESVEKAVLCEIDEKVIEVCQKHFPEFNQAFVDDRVEVVIKDAFDFLKEGGEAFDVIISDTPDPVGVAEKLFSEEFISMMNNSLLENGIITMQCENMYFFGEIIKNLYQLATTLTDNPAYYHSWIPTYPGGVIGFLYMSNSHWKNGLNKPYPRNLEYLNSETHQAAFAIPQRFKKELFS